MGWMILMKHEKNIGESLIDGSKAILRSNLQTTTRKWMTSEVLELMKHIIEDNIRAKTAINTKKFIGR